MQFSSAKSQSMLISRKKYKDLNGPTIMHGSELTSEQRLNLLGVSFSSSGTITEHVLAKAKTAGKLVSMLRRNRMFLSERARFQVYVSCVRPILEYASPLFLNSPGYALKALDRIDPGWQAIFKNQISGRFPVFPGTSGRYLRAICYLFF